MNELTARQQEVVALIGDGCSNHEIAKKLGISTKTVEVHKTQIFNRLGLTGRDELTRWLTQRARRQGYDEGYVDGIDICIDQCQYLPIVEIDQQVVAERLAALLPKSNRSRNRKLPANPEVARA